MPIQTPIARKTPTNRLETRVPKRKLAPNVDPNEMGQIQMC